MTALAAAIIGAMAAAPASADDLPVPGEPVAASTGEYSYIATPAVTRRIDGMKMTDAIARLPLPREYQPANLAFATRFEMALAATRATRGSCVQIVIDPKPAGGLFDYGFFPIAPGYCP